MKNWIKSLALTAIFLSSCGASALQDNARAATVAGLVLREARGVILSQAESQMQACGDVACVEQRFATFNQLIAGYNTCRVALTVWVESIALAHAAGSDGGASMRDVVAAGRAFLTAYADLQLAGSQGGIELPSPPSILSSLGAQ